MDPSAQLARLLRRAEDDSAVLAVILFGSTARAENGPASDVDLCLVLQPAPHTTASLTHTRLVYAREFDFDVQVFQQLPVYVRRRALKEGRVLFVRDEDALYDLAFWTVREFEDFRPHYDAYLAEVLRGGS